MGATKMFTPYDLRPTVEITAFTLTAISTLVVAIRFYCRKWIVGRFKLYDYMTLGAVLCTWALCVCNHYQLHFGSGAQGKSKHMPPTDDPQALAHRNYQLRGSATSWYFYHIGYCLALLSVKLSILVSYLSFATRRTFRILVYISILLVAIFSTTLILVIALQCPSNPLFALSPEMFLPHSQIYCRDLRAVFYWQSAFNMASDCVILVLPMPLLFRLRMHRIKRMSLIAVFSVGLLVPIASGVRLWGLYLWAHSGTMARYYGGYIILWSQVEINTAIVCASAPSLQPLFKLAFNKLPLLQRSRDACYYYGGERNSSSLRPGADVRQVRFVERDTLRELATPPLTYVPKTRIPSSDRTKMGMGSRTDEDEIRARVRAFSSPSSSTYSMPRSPAHPAGVFKNG